MSLLEISESEKTGELRWGVGLINDEGIPILRNTAPLAKGVALSTAKALKQKGSDAPLLEGGPGDPNTPAWIAKKGDSGWLVEFTLVSETAFDLLLKPEASAEPAKVVETALEVVKINLAKATIEWTPLEADPAYMEKESDVTPTKGIPGS